MQLQQWYRKKSDDDVATHIVKLENLAHRLQTLGKKISNQMIIIKILITLFPSFKYFISTWEIIQFKKRILTALKSYFKVHHGEKKSKRRQRTLLLLPININVKKNFKKGK